MLILSVDSSSFYDPFLRKSGTLCSSYTFIPQEVCNEKFNEPCPVVFKNLETGFI